MCIYTGVYLNACRQGKSCLITVIFLAVLECVHNNMYICCLRVNMTGCFSGFSVYGKY